LGGFEGFAGALEGLGETMAEGVSEGEIFGGGEMLGGDGFVFVFVLFGGEADFIFLGGAPEVEAGEAVEIFSEAEGNFEAGGVVGEGEGFEGGAAGGPVAEGAVDGVEEEHVGGGDGGGVGGKLMEECAAGGFEALGGEEGGRGGGLVFHGE